jgi:hypothetical protein
VKSAKTQLGRWQRRDSKVTRIKSCEEIPNQGLPKAELKLNMIGGVLCSEYSKALKTGGTVEKGFYSVLWSLRSV